LTVDLGALAGPCGTQFISAFKCVFDAKGDPLALNCAENFQAMQRCFVVAQEEAAKKAADKSDSAWYESNFVK
jgi:hypothetical protein